MKNNIMAKGRVFKKISQFVRIHNDGNSLDTLHYTQGNDIRKQIMKLTKQDIEYLNKNLFNVDILNMVKYLLVSSEIKALEHLVNIGLKVKVADFNQEQYEDIILDFIYERGASAFNNVLGLNDKIEICKMASKILFEGAPPLENLQALCEKNIILLNGTTLNTSFFLKKLNCFQQKLVEVTNSSRCKILYTTLCDNNFLLSDLARITISYITIINDWSLVELSIPPAISSSTTIAPMSNDNSKPRASLYNVKNLTGTASVSGGQVFVVNSADICFTKARVSESHQSRSL